jgi:hypothetical protein
MHLTTRIKKLANEDMEIIYVFIKKHFQGRFYRKPRDIDEFIEDVAEYMLNGQTKKYTQE